MSRSCVVRVVAVLAMMVAGCGEGDDLPRQAVSGLVLLNGEPLPSGTIRFEPADPEGPTSVGSSIDDGKFSISQPVGLVPGKYRVSITGSGDEMEEQELDMTNGMPGMTPKPPKEQLPAKFNSKTTLEAEVQEGAKNEFNFDLKS